VTDEQGVWFLLLGIVIWQIGSWAFAPARPPPSIPEGDGRAFGSSEKYLVEGREKQRQSAIKALDMPWGSRCSGDDRKRSGSQDGSNGDQERARHGERLQRLSAAYP
jgi:hypothetical protein